MRSQLVRTRPGKPGKQLLPRHPSVGGGVSALMLDEAHYTSIMPITAFRSGGR
jgi:hypothetical protein